ncbi:Transglutaminase, C-terminal,Transglutaminase-like,Immunoglobulin E-set,Immunoglobulin-like fold,Protein- [Cinara cedri]|uniref:protein-glutamine gamma-glutamyltransferase n=1 Tax=Cinara cedri TaxID=506608 RepID=A0A5E4NJZ0_9HEMI|nr:Transglutaminase, C-terminal,Transglutaminase-like,Immunoglobulin E-set,Immunoglobulin-like fold,Protein- [Cinara cedri]
MGNQMMANNAHAPNENHDIVPTELHSNRHWSRNSMVNRPAEPLPLNLISMDYCFLKNGKKHHTDMYYCMKERRNSTLVVRRGMPIYFELTLNRPFNINTDQMSFIFKLFEMVNTNFGNSTMAAVPLKISPNNGDGEWSAIMVHSNRTGANVLHVRITPPNNCIVGKWIMDVDIRCGQMVTLFSAQKNPMYILFNPWCPTDEVYIESEELKNEYVLNEEGLMWRGSYNNQKAVVWKYGQFHKDMLDCSFLLLLKIRRLGLIYCNDPVQVSRNLSAAVNAPDELGVIHGNWTDDFSGGTPPTSWMGSVDILSRFIRTKKPVKYGQCWVFAGVLTTVCRAIGIPCRPVTAYCAAHDTQNSLTIDYFVGDDGKIMDELQVDSIWNYHVWNEVWMARPDLKVLDRSWQVIDATPQELSDGQFKCGPASVTAVRTGEIRAPYDTAFVFSEVNADKVYWRYYGISQPLKLLRKETEAIGKLICTKAVGSWEQEDITSIYKYPENSKEERDTMFNALKKNNNLFSRYYLNEDFNEIKFDFELMDDITVGENFRVALKITNRGHKDYTIKVILRVDTVDYTGKNGSMVSKHEEEIVILHDPGSNVQYVVTVLTYSDYGKDVKNQNVFNVSCLASVIDTDYEYFGQDDFRIQKPEIKFGMEGTPVVGQDIMINLLFTNPLPVSMKNSKFIISGTSLPTFVIKVGKLISYKPVIVPFKFTPLSKGKHTITAKCTSDQLQDIENFIQFMV